MRQPTVMRVLQLALFALLPAAPLSAQEPEAPGLNLPVVEHRLRNGMTFLILRREGAPTVSFVTRFKVGSVDERPGITGIAHLLEHLLFKGTPTVGTKNYKAELAAFARIDAVADSLDRERNHGELADTAEVRRLGERLRALEDSARRYVVSNEFDEILTRNGAVGLNAATFNDGTVYFFSLPANRVELWFALESDRMANPVLREFYTERDVVAEERRLRTETQPFGISQEEFLATAFKAHPYGWPVVGHMSDIQNLKRGQVLEYFRRYYGPNNAVVAIVGDVEPERIVALAERYFGKIPRGLDHAPVVTREPEQLGERRVVVAWEAQPHLRLGYHVPEAAHPDAAALQMLSALLTQGRTSRLFDRLVIRERKASQVSSGFAPGARYRRLLAFTVVPIQPTTTEELERIVYEEIERLKTEPPSDEEVQKIRNQVEAGEVRRLQSNLGIAFQLANSQVLYDDWRETFRQSQRLRAVAPEDVQRVARKYFTPENRTVATLVTKRKETPAPAQGAVKSEAQP